MPQAPTHPQAIDIVEDQRLMRDLLASALSDDLTVTVRHVFASAEEALDVWPASPPDAAIMDITLPGMNGVNCGVQLKRLHPAVAIVLVSSHAYPTLLSRLPADVKEGWAYLLKDDVSVMSIVEALRSCRSKSGAPTPMPSVAVDTTPGVADLSPRQIEILELLAKGLSNEAIASELFITRKSVENALNRIYAMLGLVDDGIVNRRVAASALAARTLRIVK